MDSKSETDENILTEVIDLLYEETFVKMADKQLENVRLEMIDSHENSHRYDSIK